MKAQRKKTRVGSYVEDVFNTRHYLMEHVQTIAVCLNVQRIIVEWVLLFELNDELTNQGSY